MLRSRNLVISLAATAAMFGIGVLAFWDTLREMLVIPVYYLVWLAGLLINSIPQGVFLAILVAVCAVFAMAVVGKIRPQPANKPLIMVGDVSESRYRFWSRRYDYLNQSRFLGDDFAFELRKLLMAILAYQEGLEKEEIEIRVASESFPVPEAVKYLITHRSLVTSDNEKERVPQLLKRVQKRLGVRDRIRSAQICNNVEQIIEYLNDRLEISGYASK
jgi:hypothetical protein